MSDRIVPALAELGLAPEAVREVIVSHADVDHYGGDAEARRLLSSARLRSHELDRPLIESWAAIAAERYGWYRGYGLDYDAETWRWLTDAAGGEAAFNQLPAGSPELDRVLGIAAQTSFRAVAILPAVLLVVFGGIWLYDRARGGIRTERLAPTRAVQAE